VTSYAGSKPPISCLNDGLQVSTGATLGHGTIALAENSSPIPKAHFSLGNTTICLELKEAYWSQARHGIAKAIEEHGLKSEEYWSAVRKLGIQCWLNWSKTEIFDVTVLDGRK
jgi:pyrimidine-specific ribonucleoside hydrolase